MKMNTLTQNILLAVMAAVILAGTLLSIIVRTATTWACGSVELKSSFVIGLQVLFGSTNNVTPPEGCAVPLTGIRIAAAGTLGLLLALGGVAVSMWWKWRQSEGYFIREMRGRAGLAKPGEVGSTASAKAMLQRAGTIRPGLQNPTVLDVAWPLGYSRKKPVYVSAEDSIVVEGIPRSGKGFRLLIAMIIDWSGPLITTSTRSDNLTATMASRAKRGTVSVFDPQGLSGIEGALKVSPITGCHNPLVARQRAQAIVKGTALGASATNGEWAEKSTTILAQLLHAAAVGNRTINDLYEWGSSPVSAGAAVAILKSRGTPGWGTALGATLSGDPKMLGSSWFGVESAVAPLSIPSIREALNPGPGEGFDADEFLRGPNTLYLIGTGSGAGAVGGFLGAILDDVVETARKRALASPGSRLAMPLGLVLDEIANMFSWGALPRIMADGGGIGISPVVVLQAMSQAETAWSKAEADTIWSAATAKVLLGGASDVSHLSDLERLLGTRKVRESSDSFSDNGNSTSVQKVKVPVITLDELRRFPQSLGLLTYKNKRGILLDLAGWIDRADADEIKDGRKATERQQHETFRRQYESTPR